ncbi:putative secreted protein [Sorangium cellulosum So ce56]|uniref:Secreted protein n=1 Tax=Sorangium cellulosum (strain So ce56) TaxID=448385 RepID=A9GA25_SORC5|nr:putative secreted protein [Sorangium cellulosum So ce56]
MMWVAWLRSATALFTLTPFACSGDRGRAGERRHGARPLTRLSPARFNHLSADLREGPDELTRARIRARTMSAAGARPPARAGGAAAMETASRASGAADHHASRTADPTTDHRDEAPGQSARRPDAERL